MWKYIELPVAVYYYHNRFTVLWVPELPPTSATSQYIYTYQTVTKYSKPSPIRINEALEGKKGTVVHVLN
jgi:hypothetical protein